MRKSQSRPNAFRVFFDNHNWTWRHRKFQYKTAVLSALIGIALSVTALFSGQDQGIAEGVGAVVGLAGLIALWLDHREIASEAHTFQIAPLTDATHKRVSKCASAHGYDCELFGKRSVLFPVTANIAIRAGKLNSQKVEFRSDLFEIADTDNTRRAFESFRREAKVVWNDDKVRLNTDPTSFATLAHGVKLQRTSYFDFLATAYYSQREWRFRRQVEYDGLALMLDGKTLLPIDRARTAHHIGVSTLLLTANKRILIQHTSARAAVGRHVPSGSGSLDVNDIDRSSFGETLLRGALREFREETGWDELARRARNMQSTATMKHYPLGMAIDVSRGLVTDFFFLSVADRDVHTEYESQYLRDKVVVDKFEVRSIAWLDFSDCQTLSQWKKRTAKCVQEYGAHDPILAINFKLVGQLLDDVESAQDHPLKAILEGSALDAYS